MRRDASALFSLPTTLPLPAAEEDVIEALEPLLTDERRERIETILSRRTRAVVPVLDGLIDPHNTAAVLRSADAFGLQEVHVIGGDEPFLASHRVAQGTERWLDVLEHGDPAHCIDGLHERGYSVYVAEMEGQLSPEQLCEHPKLAVVFGNEHSGVRAEVKDRADGTYAIPMRGFVESLNVSVATAITLYAATRGRVGDLTEADRHALRARFMMLSVQQAGEIVAEHLRRRP
jgi:tRNA (guanosine-2'-O-)-methyltransferase